MTEATETANTGVAETPSPQALMIDHLRNLLGDVVQDASVVQGQIVLRTGLNQIVRTLTALRDD